MADYTKITDFAIKDTLAPGTPEKRVRGAEIDAEFEAIEVAIADKIDNDEKNVAGGVAGLTAQAELDTSVIPSWTDIQQLITLLGDGIAVLTGALQANLNADLLDGNEGTFYNNLDNATGSLPASISTALFDSILPNRSNISYLNLEESHTGGKATTTVIIDNTLSSVVSPDTSASNVFKIVLTQDSTLSDNIADKDGQIITLIVQQDSTGGHTLTPDALFNGTISLNSNPDEVTIFTYIVDGGERYITSVDIGAI